MSFPSWTDDPVRDAEAYSDYLDERKEEEESIICDCCGKNISENFDHYYDMDGDYYCPDCIDNRRVWL